MTPFIAWFLPWLRTALFGTTIKRAGRGALKKSLFHTYAPNLLVSTLVITGLNIVNLLIMLIFRERFSPAFISAGIVTIVTAYFVIRGVRSNHATKERVILFIILAAFFGIYVCCIVIIDWWWLAWIAKLTLELLLCYAIMLSNKDKVDATQSRIVAYVSKLFRISPDGRIAKLLAHFDPL